MNAQATREHAYRRRFLLLLGGWTVLVSVALVAVPLVFRNRLPDPLAGHWGPSGRPDGTMSFAAFMFVVPVWLLIAMCCLGMAVRDRPLPRRATRTRLTTVLAWAAAFLLGTQALTIGANLDKGHWTQASPLSWQVIPMLAGAIAVGALGWLVGRLGPGDPPDTESPTGPLIHVDPGKRPVWLSTVSAPWAIGLTFVAFASALSLAVATLLGWSTWGWSPVAPLALAFLVGLLLSAVSVRVDPGGLTVSYGLLRWPSRRVPLARIGRAWVDRRYPSDIGGWGYRGLPGSATIMIRGGECLVVRYTSGGELAISIDDAATGAALLNALIAHPPPSKERVS